MMDIKLPHDHGHNTEMKLAHMQEHKEFNGISDMFKLLGDSSRIRIFWLLCHCEECVMNVSAMVRMSSPAVSHHLKLLKATGLITSRRVGKEVYYKAAQTELVCQLHNMIEQMVEITCPNSKLEGN